MKENDKHKGLHPLEVASIKAVQSLNNELRRQGKPEEFKLNIQSTIAEIPLNYQKPKNMSEKEEKRWQAAVNNKAKNKTIHVGLLTFSLHYPHVEGLEEPLTMVLLSAQIELRTVTERYNQYGWRGELCRQFIARSIEITAMALQQPMLDRAMADKQKEDGSKSESVEEVHNEGQDNE